MKFSVSRWLAGKIKKRMWMLVLLTAIQVGLAVFGVLIAVESKRLLDAAVGGEFMKGPFISAVVTLILFVLILLFFRYLSADLKERLLIELDRDWKIELLNKLLGGEFSEVQKYHSGELVNRLSQDVDNVDQGIVTVVPGIFAMVTRLIGAAVVLFLLEPVLTSILLGVGVLMIVSTTALRRILKEYHKKVAASNGKVNGFIQEAMEKLLLVQALDVSGEMERREKDHLDERKKVQTKRKTYAVLGMTGMNVVMNILYYGALIVCAVQLFRGEIMIGTLTAVTQLVGQLQAPFTGLSAMINSYITMKGSAERLRELYELNDREKAECDPKALYESMDALTGRNVTFTYPGDPAPTIEALSFSVPKGSFIAVTGESGIGKSTLLKLLLGIYRPEEGSISAGSTVLSGATRRLFSYVPQGNILISGTIRD
ncbi:MAG: ABC transporter ATP-binding protein, partial [Lachnospiraceae bacterium]|nr:ABC transporter ATP-binding protein [Lachnospiraceae bacterium]